jgi:hypothetical protein
VTLKRLAATPTDANDPSEREVNPGKIAKAMVYGLGILGVAPVWAASTATCASKATELAGVTAKADRYKDALLANSGGKSEAKNTTLV